MSIAEGDRGEGATLQDVIAAGDYIAHSILNADELRRGLAKLTAADYAREETGRFFLTDEGRTLYNRARGSQPEAPLAVWDVVDELLGVTGAPADPSAFDHEKWAYPSVTPRAVREASDEYHREFRARYERRYGKR